MNPTQRAEHWDDVYRRRDVERASWYRPHLDVSLALIERSGVGPGAAIIDVGGGAATLVDDLLARGFDNLTVLDVSTAALEAARSRLGTRGDEVRWIRADITDADLSAGVYDLWHDRAVFHFLVTDADRVAYVAALRRALQPRGQAILATFGPDGPERCSGLPVRRLGPDDLLAAAGPGFTLCESRRETHTTPSGAEQSFTWVRLLRSAPALVT